MLGPSASDNELWDAIKANDEQAFAVFFDRYWLRLYKTAYHFSKDEDTSKDLVHNVFLTFWERRSNLEIDDFVSYLNAAVRHEVFRFLKKRKNSMVTYVDELPIDLKQEVQNEAILTLGKADLEAHLNSHLKKLPKRCADIFRMSKIQQLKNDEIAAQLGITKHTVENQLSYAMRHMQQAFKGLPLLMLTLRSFDFW